MSTQPENELSTQKPAEGALCPQCQKPLEKVRYPSDSMLNRDQWDSIRAGDWLCSSCPDNGRANRPAGAYFWEGEVAYVPAAPTPAVAPPIDATEWLRENYPNIVTDALITAEICGWNILNHRGEVTYRCQRKPGHDAPHETIEDRGTGKYKKEVRRSIPLAELLDAYYAACRSKEK